ncbi:MAG: outer membrane beta-barrel family protein, partial [Leadbetterella sp.]|nr:outer membrane beta-barrel family protein [Leadbetterella sp.]
KNLIGNINIQHQPDESRNININLDYLVYDNKNPTDYRNDHFSGDGKFTASRHMFSTKHTTIRMLPMQVDYSRKMGDKAGFESGVKAVFNSFTNDVAVDWLQDGNRIPDPEFSADYSSRENIAAAYVSAKWHPDTRNTFQAGLRYEYTTTQLGTTLQKNIIDRKYGEWFPTLYWSRTLGRQQQVSLALNRRINRPSFNDLAPFIIFWDPNTFMSGNSALQPSLSQAVKADYIFRHWVFSIGYTYEKNAIGPFQVTMDTEANKQYMTAQNLDYLKTLNSSLTLPVTITPWWRFQVVAQVNHQEARASYTPKINTVSIWSGAVSGSQNFTLGSQYAIELSGNYQTSTLFGVSKIKPLGMLNFAIRKKIARTGATWIAGVDDIFPETKSKRLWTFRGSTTMALQISSFVKEFSK